MDFVLERDQERIVLECGKSYSCGRGLENTIICRNVQVSRKHCIFLRTAEKLFVTDLKSSNGIFINGIVQESYKMVQLSPNDIVGIGCPDISPDDDKSFVYKVCVTKTSDLVEVADTSDLSSTVAIGDTPTSQKQSNSYQDYVSGEKQINSCSFGGPSTNTNISNNEDICNISKEIASEIAVCIKQENDVEIIDAIFPEKKEWNLEDKIFKYETYLKRKIKSERQTDEMDIDKDDKSNSKNGKSVNNIRAIRKNTNNFGRINSTLHSKESRFVHYDDKSIKYEDDLQLTDEDEEALLAASKTKATDKTTPMKLKKIKHESKTRFSEVDVVDLSDSEDGVFPYSQLFDIKFEDNVKQDVEIKQECVGTDTEKVHPLDIVDNVIVLTDSEDDDNPWLHRLSRSQLINEDKKPDVVSSIVKEEIDLGIWQEDDIAKIMVRSPIPGTSKDFQDFSGVAGARLTDAPEDSACEETSFECRTSTEKKIKREDFSNIKTGTDPMDIDDVDVFNELSSENTDHSAGQKAGERHNAELYKQAETSSSTSSPVSGAKSRSKFAAARRRVISLIEAPHLPPKRGRGKSSDRKDSSRDRNKTSKTSEDKSPSGSTIEESRMQQLKEKLDDHFYSKEQKQNKGSSKESSDHTVSSIANRPSISKQEKKIIMEERKAKLKRIAEEEKLAADGNKNIKRGTAKPRVKVSLKNRGDFLCEEREMRASKSSSSKFAERAKSIVCKNAVNNMAATLEQSLNLNNMLDIDELPEKHDDTADSSVIGKKKKHNNSRVKGNKVAENINGGETAVSKSPEKSRGCASILRQEKRLTKTKKKKGVTFSPKVDVKEYEIESKNTLKKLVGKDAPIPVEKLVKAEKTTPEWYPKLEEYLLRIFMWNPVWLEEQRYLNSEPPVVRDEELQPMKIHYESFRHYYNVALPLLLLETWHKIYKDFEIFEKNVQQPTMMCSIVKNSITRTPIPTTNHFLTTLMLEVLVTKQDEARNIYPQFGDLVSFEYVQYMNGRQIFHKVFAYITQIYRTTITDFTRYNKELENYVKNPHTLISYTVQTRPIEHDILLTRLNRMRAVRYLRPEMRMVQAVHYLPQSPLLKLILNPKFEDCSLPPMNPSFTCNSLVTKDNLNPKQLEAVFRVTETVTKKEPKLCLIQGPPGTGKSKVIVNLVTQILYGEREPRNDAKVGKHKIDKAQEKSKTKILLCAPSNAALDEVVLRLIAIRPSLKQKYSYGFNLVRIGRQEHIHRDVKCVSSSELARRFLQRLSENACCYSSNSTTNVRMELMTLKTKIDSLKNELTLNLTEAKRRECKRALSDAAARYELLQTGRLFHDVNVRDRERYQRYNEEVIIAGADIIACTLASCYTNQMESIFGPNRERLSFCIVDEATQSCEAETLIPLMLGIDTLVLVGDPNQLPATVLSQRAKKLGLDQSVFSRMEHAFALQENNPIITLDTQYRMQYFISYWPNKYFYDNKLKNSVENRLAFPFHSYRVLNHNSAQNNDKFSNTNEAEFVSNMIYTMLRYAKWENTNDPISLGVLTPYNNQRSVMTDKINEKISNLPDFTKRKITYEVNTVDGFQGQERDIVIISCVRSHGIGFLSDKHRLCVALTRAKHSLILCGNFNTFMRDPMWNSLLSDARSRGVLCDVNANAPPVVIKQFVVK
ncbi:PREDICTED: uncharacterized ATP-dependent helicase C29A10.10c isoform X2 [Dinoponera quadriceps]|uniref:Uncharacterized ATP-dependent helicase C29A10.10c isoform X2 n=1 Tax=Dinoponera quadriceps TaxID=609295 RepID=A0A6P3YBJ8_DINQU|nr:PREDICTED: uncharacterized ATP-dependent helicase C29A10.10c isoform X2 [Dinoponera quadriceps]